MRFFISRFVVRKSMFIMSLFIAFPVLGYEIVTHRQMTTFGGIRSQILSDNSFAWHIGLGVDSNSPISYEYALYDEGALTLERPWRVVDLIEEGSEREDDFVRVVNHFFDPVNGSMLDTDLEETESPTWGLEDDGLDHQEWSYPDFIDYLYSAATATTESEASRHYALAFRSLGHVVHLIQDMAQPEHARVDGHCYVFAVCYLFTEEGQEYSFYEWFSGHLSGGGFRNSAGETVVQPSVMGTYPNVHLYNVRDYWTQDNGMGLADYTNRGFVSPDTNFTLDENGSVVTSDFDQPGLDDWDEITLDGSDVVLYDGTPLPGELTLIRTPMTDSYLGTGPEWTHNTSTRTLLSSDIREAIDDGVPSEYFEGHNSEFYLNRFNYESANRHLFQRAVGYTAGFIDHVFRGRLEIAPPDGGIYAAIDHATTNEAGDDVTEGFESIRLKLRNATQPQESPDSLVASDGHLVGSGELVAVALYRPNPCYTADLKGERHFDGTIPNGCSSQEWLQTEQHRSVSTEIDLPDGLDTEEFSDFTFDFSDDPIPVNARDLSIQVIFRGQLGGDDDAFAIVRKDISEPTWFGSMNSTDYFGVDGEYRETDEFLNSSEAADWGIITEQQRIEWGRQDVAEMAYFNYTTGERLTEWVPLQEHQYHRMAVLVEPEEMFWIEMAVLYEHKYASYALGMSPIRTWLEEELQLVNIPGYGDITRLQRTWYYSPVSEYRGVSAAFVYPLNFRLGEPIEYEDWFDLPALPQPGAPEPIALTE